MRFSVNAFFTAVKNECEVHTNHIVGDMIVEIRHAANRLCGKGEDPNNSDALSDIQSASIVIQTTTKAFERFTEVIERRVKGKLRFPDANLEGYVDLLDVMEVISEMRSEVEIGASPFDLSPIEYIFEESSSFFDEVIRKSFVEY